MRDFCTLGIPECDEELFADIIAALSLTMDLEENRKLYHAWRVGAVSDLLAQDVGAGLDRAQVFYAGLLHDIGAIGLPDHIIHYPTLEEQLKVKEVVLHPERGAQIVQNIPGLAHSPVLEMIRDHHEYWNGRGYPTGKRDDDISLGGQIIRIADAFDLACRVQDGSVWHDVLGWLSEGAGEEFSRDLFSSCIDLFRTDRELFQRVVDDSALSLLVRELQSEIYVPVSGDCEDPIRSVLLVFAKVIDAKHTYTMGHSERVAGYSLEIGRTLGMSPLDLRVLEAAALLHDAGKVAVPRSVLDRAGPLTTTELALVREHPKRTMEIVSTIAGFEKIAWIAGHHHERYDGKGYPDGLSGDDIPLGSRILAVADALDAMTSGRPYQKNLEWEDALKVIRENAGTQFDPEVAGAAMFLVPQGSATCSETMPEGGCS